MGLELCLGSGLNYCIAIFSWELLLFSSFSPRTAIRVIFAQPN